jgi:hypothetical protein
MNNYLKFIKNKTIVDISIGLDRDVNINPMLHDFQRDIV